MAGAPTSSEQHQLRLEHSGAQADDLPQERKNPEPRTTPAPRPKHRGPLESCKLLFAGAMSAVVARTCVAPLERVKMELVLRQGQGNALSTAAQVFRVEGLPGFWKGNALNVLRTAPFKAINFCAFDSFHTLLTGLTRQDDNTARFTAGALAGVTATLICFPLDVVRTRLLSRAHTSRYGSNPFVNLAGMLRDEGPGALYSGECMRRCCILQEVDS